MGQHYRLRAYLLQSHGASYESSVGLTFKNVSKLKAYSTSTSTRRANIPEQMDLHTMDRQNVDLQSHNLELRARSNSNSRLKTRVKKTSKSNKNISGGERGPRASTCGNHNCLFSFSFFPRASRRRTPGRSKEKVRPWWVRATTKISEYLALALSLLYIHWKRQNKHDFIFLVNHARTMINSLNVKSSRSNKL